MTEHEGPSSRPASENFVALQIERAERRTDRVVQAIRDEIREGIGNIVRRIELVEQHIGVGLNHDSGKITPMHEVPEHCPAKNGKALDLRKSPVMDIQWRDRIVGSLAGALLVACILEPGVVTGVITSAAVLLAAIAKLLGGK